MLDFLNFADMHTVLVMLFFAVGIVFIVKGGDWFVDAASWIAEAAGIPKFIVGATIVSVATTLPELITSIIATSGGSTELAVGNAVGSVTANLGLIMALSVIFLPSAYKRSAFAPKALLMMGGAVLLFILCMGGKLNFLPAMTLFILFGMFIYENIASAKKSMEVTENRPKITGKEAAVNLTKFVFGTAGIVLGADLLVDTATELAVRANVPQTVIGVTIVAVGTSLPELVTTVTAIVKKQSSLSVGNIIGANIIDLTLILPICSAISGGALPVADQMVGVDMPVCCLVAAIAVLPTLISQRFKRWQSFAMISVYILYLLFICVFQ